MAKGVQMKLSETPFAVVFFSKFLQITEKIFANGHFYSSSSLEKMDTLPSHNVPYRCNEKITQSGKFKLVNNHTHDFSVVVVRTRTQTFSAQQLPTEPTPALRKSMKNV